MSPQQFVSRSFYGSWQEAQVAWELLLTACVRDLLAGSWLAIGRVISRVTIGITHIRGLITPLVATHAPPSRGIHKCIRSLLGTFPGFHKDLQGL